MTNKSQIPHVVAQAITYQVVQLQFSPGITATIRLRECKMTL